MENKVKFEKVGDVNSEYSYLEVYLNNYTYASIGISINKKKELIFTIYKNSSDILLTINQLSSIVKEAQIFLKDEIKNEEFFNNFINSPDALE